jgi:hypothetical protein
VPLAARLRSRSRERLVPLPPPLPLARLPSLRIAPCLPAFCYWLQHRLTSLGAIDDVRVRRAYARADTPRNTSEQALPDFSFACNRRCRSCLRAAVLDAGPNRVVRASRLAPRDSRMNLQRTAGNQQRGERHVRLAIGCPSRLGSRHATLTGGVCNGLAHRGLR